MDNKRKKVVRLQDSLIINQLILNLIQEDFASLNSLLNSSDLEGIDIDNESYYYKRLINRTVEREFLTNNKLKEYDKNIVRHTNDINENRTEKIKWKYFQYISLLFTEIYLDLYFNNQEFLLKELNYLVNKVNEEKKVDLSNYDSEDLAKIAFWSATGSGKTLIMHVNILQYLYYCKKSKKNLDNIILITPNESLSKQHLIELQCSNIKGQLFDKEMDNYLLSEEREILIIDIYKLKEVDGEKTIAIDSFEGDNLILVDEGHRGSTGTDWKRKRNILSKNGFTFEYSATFGQTVSKNKVLYNEYSKSIIFDYSYKYFYKDGYGKDYNIINLESNINDSEKYKYLTACILTFYQQQLIYRDNKDEYKQFNFENPLLVFVGSSVNAVKKVNKVNVSDVTEIIRYFSFFIKNEEKIKSYLSDLLQGKSSFYDAAGKDIFSNSYNYLNKKGFSLNKLYINIKSTVFNTTSNRTLLRIERLKNDENELVLKIDDSKPFAIINVGDGKSLLKLCMDIPNVITDEIEFGENYFQKINSKDSKINILIGSKKFSEGWSSWRVSSMGLLNIGKNEGSQIIQLFGRGVRLKGYETSLKRSEFIRKEIELPSKNKEYIKYLETLNIFGVNASYMQIFKEYLQEEGLEVNKKENKVIIPTKLNIVKGLKSLRISSKANFENWNEDIIFKYNDKLIKNKIILNWYSKINVQSSFNSHLVNYTINEENFNNEHLKFLNYDFLYFELVKYKKEKKYFKVLILKENIEELLSNNNWYTIQIPKNYMELDDWENIDVWNELSLVLLRKYIDRLYYYEKNRYEAPFIELYDYELSEDQNYIQNYEVITKVINEQENLYSAFFRNLKFTESKNYEVGNVRIFNDDLHLYNPVIYFNELKNEFIQITPTPLNKFEYKFMLDLNLYLKQYEENFKNKKIYLLRNQSKGKGLGFFEGGNFYPDFIMWLIIENKQYINFIDPKGIRNVSVYDEKIQFSKKIKEIEMRINHQDTKLNSFILSNTPYENLINLGPELTIDKLESSNVLFMVNDTTDYLKKMFDIILKN